MLIEPLPDVFAFTDATSNTGAFASACGVGGIGNFSAARTDPMQAPVTSNVANRCGAHGFWRAFEIRMMPSHVDVRIMPQFRAGRAADRPRIDASKVLARVLRGEAPRNIPFENVAVKKLVLNQRWPKSLGITFPAEMVQAAAQ